MPHYPDAAILDVLHVDDETGERTKVGEVEYDSDGRLRPISIAPTHEALWRDAIGSVNAKLRIFELVPPLDGTPLAIAAKATERDDDDFQDALSRYLERYYGFALL
jgi:hypothetical protein